jgi:predicted CoA-substrate-specific enzyme activase
VPPAREAPLFLGIDVGSVSTNVVLIDRHGAVRDAVYVRTGGDPVAAIRAGLRQLAENGLAWRMVAACGASGSARRLAAALTGSDLVKNEITAHAVAAAHCVPDVRTVIEIGGQDSKLICLREGIACDFAMNTVCAAGTGAFLDAQAARLGIPVEQFGALARRARGCVAIAGRCTVFAESDMVHKQQLGHPIESIVKGLCQALVRNYLTDVARGRDILPPIVFQGGVSANAGIRDALEHALGQTVIVPKYNTVMGAIGMALLVRMHFDAGLIAATSFRGAAALSGEARVSSFECLDCPNRCEVMEVCLAGHGKACWNDRCGKRSL